VKDVLQDQLIDPEIDESAKQKMRLIGTIFLGDFAERVAVLGAFDTWPIMDCISRRLAFNNYVAVTSRYVYRKVNGSIMRMRTQEHPGFAPQYHFMGALLDQIISDSSSAVINFSISAAHFIEIDWCYKKSKKTLGIAYVRAISGLEKNSCENLHIVETADGSYSVCKTDPQENRTAWDCMRMPMYCPFLGQDISKNVVEYFFRGKDMEIVAVENIGVLPSVLDVRYPRLADRDLQVRQLDDDVTKDDETIFSKGVVYFVLMLKKLQNSSCLNRLSPVKILGLLQKTPGWSDSRLTNQNKVRRFVSKKLGDEELVKCVKQGFVDIDRIGANHEDLATYMKGRGYVELKRIESTSGMKGTFVRLSPKGSKLSKIYMNL